jgi:hypothetical protein
MLRRRLGRSSGEVLVSRASSLRMIPNGPVFHPAPTETKRLRNAARRYRPSSDSVSQRRSPKTRQQMGLYGPPHEWRDLQTGQISYALDRDTGSFVEVDILRPVVTHNVKQRDQPSVSLVVHGLGEKYRVLDNKTGLFPHFPKQRFFDGLAVLDRTPKASPTARVGDSGLVVTMMHEQPAVGHDQQHRRPAP